METVNGYVALLVIRRNDAVSSPFAMRFQYVDGSVFVCAPLILFVRFGSVVDVCICSRVRLAFINGRMGLACYCVHTPEKKKHTHEDGRERERSKVWIAGESLLLLLAAVCVCVCEIAWKKREWRGNGRSIKSKIFEKMENLTLYMHPSVVCIAFGNKNNNNKKCFNVRR